MGMKAQEEFNENDRSGREAATYTVRAGLKSCLGMWYKAVWMMCIYIYIHIEMCKYIVFCMCIYIYTHIKILS